ncbi:hypothetical protein ACQP1G_17135 [Nocardia sp. CA-107356]|uniref:hypothetical protein n=1 Tax=Nocardia sp. CA-107356 TaxID=3239972 RepID=UPI003D9009D4
MSRPHRPIRRQRYYADPVTKARPLTMHDLHIVARAFGFRSVGALVDSLLCLSASSKPPPQTDDSTSQNDTH